MNLGGQSFDQDELWTAWYTHASLHDLFSNVARHENTPYAYYFLLWLWAHAFGHGEAGIRSLSALAGAATVPVAAGTARVLAGARVGVAAALLVAVNPFLIWYSQEARSYALFTLLAAVALWFFARAMTAEDSPDVKTLRWWSACSALALAVNYFAVFSIAGEALLLIWRSLRAKGREGLWRVMHMLLLPLIVGLVLLPLEIFQRHHSPVGDIAKIALWKRVLQIPKAFIIAYSAPAELMVTLVAGVLALLATVPVFRARGEIRAGAMIAAGIAILGIGLPVLAAPLGIDYVNVRYLIAAVIPALIVVACGAVQRAASLAAMVALCGLSAFVVVAVASDPSLQRADWRGAARALGPAVVPRAIVMTPDWDQKPVTVYFAGVSRCCQSLPLRVHEVDLLALASVGRFTTGAPRPPRPPTPKPPPGFTLQSRTNATTYTLIRYTAPSLRIVNPFGIALMALAGSPAVWLEGSSAPTR